MADTLIQGTTIIEDKRREFGKVISIPGCAFRAVDNTNTQGDTNSDGELTYDAGGNSLTAPIQLPHGAVITGAVFYSNGAGTITWELKRVDNAGTSSVLATAQSDTEDTSITNSTVDNITYSYFFYVADTSTNSTSCQGARVTYE